MSKPAYQWTPLLILLSAFGATPAQQAPVVAPPTQPPTQSNAPAIPAAPPPLGCVDISALTTAETPAQIFPGMRKCLDSQDYERAVRLFAVASAYGRFDMQRVRDPSAHEVIPALQQAYLGDVTEDVRQRLIATQKTVATSDQLNQMCTQIRNLGPPTYYPSYMLLHGMSSVTGQGGGLQHDFNSASAWESVLTSYLYCRRGH